MRPTSSEIRYPLTPEKMEIGGYGRPPVPGRDLYPDPAPYLVTPERPPEPTPPAPAESSPDSSNSDTPAG